MDKYRYWDILDDLPEGWVIDKTAGSHAPNTVFITNGKSPLKGQKRALLRVSAKRDTNISQKIIEKPSIEKANDVQEIETPFPAKTVNDLARLKFKEQLLKEIIFDLMVCEIEGWDKKEYINELKSLINGIETKGHKNAHTAQTKLF